jgi:hypothetical protein
MYPIQNVMHGDDFSRLMALLATPLAEISSRMPPQRPKVTSRFITQSSVFLKRMDPSTISKN